MAGTFKSTIISLILVGVSMFCGARQASADLLRGRTSSSSGRRHRPIQRQRLHQWLDGLSHAQYRLHRKDGVIFTDYYGEQSCTAGRASFITGQSGLRTGLTKVGMRAPISDCRRKIDDRGASQGAGLRDGPIRQESPWRQDEFLPPRMASMNSMAISTILTRRRSRNSPIIRKPTTGIS